MSMKKAIDGKRLCTYQSETRENSEDKLNNEQRVEIGISCSDQAFPRSLSGRGHHPA